jgi:alpha-beta hydrolase superfamily lysophospholipase
MMFDLSCACWSALSHPIQWGLASWAFGNAAALVAQRRLIYKPPRHRRSLIPGPHAGSYAVEALSLPVAAGVVLEGWCSRPLDGSSPRATLLYFGGRGENVIWAPHMSSYTRGLSVLAFNYRGFGGSSGVVDEARALRDARRFWADFVAPAGAPCIVMGRSLGTALAVRLASEVAPDALVLVSPFDSLPALLARRLPWLWPAARLMHQRLDAKACAAQVRCPTLAVLARGDRHVPLRHSQALLDALGGPVERHELQGEHHRSLPRSVSTQQLVGAFVAAACAAAAPVATLP